MKRYKRLFEIIALITLLCNLNGPIEKTIAAEITVFIYYGIGYIFLSFFSRISGNVKRKYRKSRIRTIKHVTTDDDIISSYDSKRFRNNEIEEKNAYEDKSFIEEQLELKNEDKLSGYESSKSIASETEKLFYNRLKQYCYDRNFTINLKTRLEDLVKYNNYLTFAEMQKYRGQIKSRHVDYLIVDDDLKPIFAIELDDKSHNRRSAQEVDKFKDELFKKINIPLYRVPADEFFWKLELEKIFVNYEKQL